MKKELIKIGKIIKTNGIKGICFAIFYIDDENSLSKYKKFYLDGGVLFDFSIYSKTINNQKLDLSTKSYRFLIKIKDVFNINDAIKYINKDIYINKLDIINKEDEFLIKDLIDNDVYVLELSEFNKACAKVYAVHDFGSGPIIEIKPDQEFQKLFGSNLMYPFNDEFFPKIDLENKRLFLDIKNMI